MTARSATIAALLWLAVGHASAQPDALTLARLAVHESGWDSPADVALIHEVLTGIVERDHVSYRTAARLAAPRFARCAVRRRWACGLREDGRAPPHWHGARWERYRDRWTTILEVARTLLAGGTVAPACRERPRVWGSRADVARGRARGRRWVDAGCRARNLGGRWE
jgi:hypothetical protein